jgi:ABC-type amino acid transport substrate-binding protein
MWRMFRTMALSMAVAICFLGQAKANPIQINDVNWIPFFMQGERKGFAHEIMQAFLDEQKLAHEFVLLPPPRTEDYMKAGQIDLCVYSYKKEREEFIWYGKEAIFSISYRIPVRSDAKLPIKGLEDLKGYRLGRTRGIAYTPEITEFLDRKEIVAKTATTKDLTSQIRMLAAGHLDAIIESTSSIGWEVSELGLAQKIQFVGAVISSKPYFLTISKASTSIPNGPHLLAAFDAWFRKFKTKPEYAALAQKYGIPR